MKTGWYLVYPDGDKFYVNSWGWIALLALKLYKKYIRSRDTDFAEYLDKCRLEKFTEAHQ